MSDSEEVDQGPAVAVAYVHEDRLDYSFFHSFVQLLGYDAEHAGRVWRGGFVPQRGTTGDMAAGRNGAVAKFLGDDTAQWLWWIDTDMGFEPDAIDRLLEVADPVARPIVGALCFAQREYESDSVGGFRPVAWPTVMDWAVYDGQGGFEVRWDYPRNALTRCHGTGSACILIHRSVFEKIRDEYEQVQRDAGMRKDGDPRWEGWYTRVTNPTTGELAGEDLSFCMRLMRVGIPLHVHTGVQTTHRKNIWLQEQDYWRQRALAPPPETIDPIPADQRAAPRYAIVPTHNRPERLAALVASLGRQVDTIVVLDNASDPPVDPDVLRAAAGGASVHVLFEPEQPPHLSRYWNVMFDVVSGLAKAAGQDVWDVGVFNDDSIVPGNWFDVVSVGLRGHEKAVVGHTGTFPVHSPELVDAYPYPREKRMCPWAFVVRGEAGLRADESMAFWYFDDDFNRAAIDAGGVLAVPGPLVINAHANEATFSSPVLIQLTERDREAFEAKWGQP